MAPEIPAISSATTPKDAPKVNYAASLANAEKPVFVFPPQAEEPVAVAEEPAKTGERSGIAAMMALIFGSAPSSESGSAPSPAGAPSCSSTTYA